MAIDTIDTVQGASSWGGPCAPPCRMHHGAAAQGGGA
jgi:hypothetical protein